MQLRNHFVGLTLSAVCALGPLGCGDDTSGTGGGSTSSTTSSTTTTTTTTTSGTGGAGGEGGMAQGGGGVGGMAQGGGGAGMGGMGGMGGMNMGGGGAGGGTTMTPSQQIAAVLGTADGTGLNLVVADAIVTYVKPAIGADAAGFFVQADQMGPALFVAVDPATLTPAPVVGDEVMFTVTAVSTTTGLKHASAIASFMRHSQNNDVTTLVTDISAASDVLTNLDGYTARAVSFIADIDADFVTAGSPQVAAPITTSGLSDPDYRLRMPEAVRATYDLEMGCTLIVDYGVMWRFNAVAQPSALSTNDIAMGDVDCFPPTVAMAQAASSTSVVITFDRLLDPASVQASDFTFTGGLTASAVMVSGKTVTVTTSAQTSGTSYTVTVAGVTDVLGEVVDPALDEAMFTGYQQVAGLIINEIKPNIGTSRDLLELLATSAGSVDGITLVEEGTGVTTIATLPNVQVAMGDLIVIHLNASGATGAAPGSETTAKNEYPAAMYAANYDGAWDFHGGTTGIGYANRVLKLNAPGNVTLDALPVVESSLATPLAAFPARLQAIQAAGLWLPVDCGGQLCTYTSTPTAISISVDYLGAGGSSDTAAGNSIARKPGMNTMQKSDWNAAGPNSFGLVNP